MNLYQKIVEVRKVAEGFSKDGFSYGYSYVTGNQVLSKIKDKMNDLNLLLFPSTKTGEHHTHAYKTAKGKDALDFVVKGEMSYTWINGDEPSEREVISWAYYGQQDDISKAYGSALTYSERYFLLKCLGLPTDEDDPDAKKEGPKANASNAPQGSYNRPSNPPAQNTSQATQPAASAPATPDMVSDPQLKMIGRLKNEKKLSDDAYRKLLSEKFRVSSTKDLSKRQATEFIKFLQESA
jgi:hypothetical protein